MCVCVCVLSENQMRFYKIHLANWGPLIGSAPQFWRTQCILRTTINISKVSVMADNYGVLLLSEGEALGATVPLWGRGLQFERRDPAAGENASLGEWHVCTG